MGAPSARPASHTGHMRKTSSKRDPWGWVGWVLMWAAPCVALLLVGWLLTLAAYPCAVALAKVGRLGC